MSHALAESIVISPEAMSGDPPSSPYATATVVSTSPTTLAVVAKASGLVYVGGAGEGACTLPVDITAAFCVPPMYETVTTPVDESTRIKSTWPSAFKSPADIIGVVPPRLTAVNRLTPCDPPSSHTCAAPEEGSC